MKIYLLSIIHSNSYVQGVYFLQAPSCKSVIRYLWSKQTTSWNLILCFCILLHAPDKKYHLQHWGSPENQSLSCYFACLSCALTSSYRHTHCFQWPQTPSSLFLTPCCPWEVILLPCQFYVFWFFHHSEQHCFSTAFLDLTTGLVISHTTDSLFPDNFIISQSIFISQWMNLTHVGAARNQK